MNTKIRRCIQLALYILCLTGCVNLDTLLTIPEPKLPETFKQPNSVATIATLNWRSYFDDPRLVELIDAAVKSNNDLQIALQRIESSRSSIKLANGALLPQVGLNIGGGVRKFGLYTMDGAGNISTEITPGETVPTHLPDIYVGLQASWEVDIWGKLRNQRQSAVAQYLSTIEGTNFVISSLVADIAMYYNELIALDKEIDIIKQTIQKQQEALEVIKIQKETGRANALAVQQFQAQLLSTQALEIKVVQQVVELENKINFLLGRYPQPIKRSKDSLFKALPRQIVAGMPSQLLANRPDVRAAELQIAATKFDVQVAKAAFFPNFNMTAGFGFQAFNPEFLFMSPASIAYSVMGSLVTPLINRNALEAQFNTAKANQLSAMYNYQKSILNSYVEVVNELSNIHNLQQIHALKKQQNEVLQQSVSTANELYKYAKATYLEVLIAQQNALQSNIELITVSKQQRLAEINVYKALGGGWR